MTERVPNRPVPAMPPVLKPGDRVGQFEVVEPLANGGMGSVYKVHCGEGLFVLKLLTLHFLDESETSDAQREHRLRAKRELLALELLDHPNIVRVYCSGIWPEPTRGWFYLVMEYVDGSDIASWREEEKPSLRQILAACEGVARALEEVHRVNLQHRDIKVENVLVRRGTSRAVLIDFGVVRHGALPAVTMRAEIIGTETNYAPEYVKYIVESGAGRRGPYPWSASDDLWGLGCVIYTVLTGRSPFDASAGREALLSAILNASVPDAQEVNPAIPTPLAELVMRLLEKDPAARPGSAAEVGDALRDILSSGGAELDRPFSVALQVTDSTGEDGPALIAAGLPTWCREQIAGGGAEDPAPGRAGERETADTGEIASARIDLEEEDPSATPAPARKSGKGSGIATAFRMMHERVAASSPRRWRSWRLAAMAFGILACGLVFAMTRSGKPEKDDMLARLERQQGGSRRPAIAVELGAVSSAAPRLSTPDAPRLSASDAANIDAALAARYGRPTVPPAGSAPPASPQAAMQGVAAPDASASAAAAQAGGGPPTGAPLAPKAAGPMPAASVEGGTARHPQQKDPFLYAVFVDPAAQAPVENAPRRLGIAMGTHIRARLVSNLDSRTISSGPVEAVLPHPLVIRGKEVLPERTTLYGRATENMGRFNIQFTRLRLPNDTELEFEGLALDRGDNKPGLAAGAQITPQGYEEEGVGTRIARGTGNTVLNTVTGGVAADVMRGAGGTVVNHRASTSGGGEMPAILLDAGVLFDVFVAKSF